MNKKFLFGMLAAGMLTATSCQSDLDVVQSGNESVVSFTLEQPGISTRAYSDGLTATTLTYAVYEAGEKTPLITSTDEVKFADKTAIVNLSLVTGKSYDIVFWADAEGAPYTFDATTQSITVDYSNAASQDEKRDAFYATKKSLTVTGPLDETITLHRPFAQLNIGCTDAKESTTAAFTPTQTSVQVKNVYTTINLFDGAVSNETEVNFDLANVPANEVFPVAGAEYLAMNYLLVANEKELVDVAFTATDGAHSIAREYASVPVQRNYRTNIYGKILTDPVNYTVIIEAEYKRPDYEVVVWDGKTVTKPASTANEWIITTAAEWVYLKQNGVQGKNIKLAASLDFGGYAIKGLAFEGEFDGQGYAMSNMTIVCGGSYYSNGLFQGDASGNVTVKNLTIEKATAECANPDQGYVGTIFGDVQNGTVTLEGVNVQDVKLCGVQSVGGLVGFVGGGATLNVNNCTVDGSVISNYAVENESGFVAGLVGRPVGTVNVNNSTVTNTTIDAFYAPRRGEASIQPVVGSNTTLTAGSDVKVIKKYYLPSGVENNGTVYKTLDEALAAVTTEGVITLSEGTYTLPAAAKGKTISFIGAGNKARTVIKCDASSAYNLNGSKATFENITIESDGTTYRGFTHVAGATFKNCTIKNQLTMYNDGSEAIQFEECNFEVSGDSYNFWSWGANVTFTACIFNCDGKAALVYGETPESTVTFTDCTFNDRGGIDGKAAIETGDDKGSKYNVHINNCQVNGFDVTTPKKELGGDDLGTNVWGNKDLMTRESLNVYIDGTEVY